MHSQQGLGTKESQGTQILFITEPVPLETCASDETYTRLHCVVFHKTAKYKFFGCNILWLLSFYIKTIAQYYIHVCTKR
jgi:hypothetical protein